MVWNRGTKRLPIPVGRGAELRDNQRRAGLASDPGFHIKLFPLALDPYHQGLEPRIPSQRREEGFVIAEIWVWNEAPIDRIAQPVETKLRFAGYHIAGRHKVRKGQVPSGPIDEFPAEQCWQGCCLRAQGQPEEFAR